MSWSDAPSWISAVAAAGALAAAVVAGVTARRLYAIERARDRRASAADARRQAAAISAWVAEAVGPNPDERSPGVVVANASDTAVRDVSISVVMPSGQKDPLRLTVLPPGDYFTVAEPTAYHWGFPNRLDALQYPVRPVMRSREWYVAELRFRDAADREWRRDGTGTLRPVSGNEGNFR